MRHRLIPWVAERLGLIVLGFLVLVLAVIGGLTITRGTPVRYVVAEGSHASPPPVTDSLFTRTFELYTFTHVDGGNAVQLLDNGNETYPTLWRDLASARRAITIQMYYCQPGAVADSLQKYLMARARAGVKVLALFDEFGSAPLLHEGGWLDSLQRAGVRVAHLRPLHWYDLNEANFRSHVRVVTVDGRVGYTGGFGLADYWLGDGRHPEQWRESNVRFEGPLVGQLQAAFAAGWAEATGELLTGDLFFPPQSFARAGNVTAGLLYATPTTGSTNAERYLAVSIAAARRSLYVTNSYFVPDDDFQQLLIRAAHRGVDVRVLTAGDRSDVKTTTLAGRARYERLLREGIRIWEYGPTMIHSKTLVVDGVWSSVGSLNFDNRSLAFNNESVVIALDRGIGTAMDSVFLQDLRYSKEILLPEWGRRSLWERLLEDGANMLSRLL